MQKTVKRNISHGVFLKPFDIRKRGGDSTPRSAISAIKSTKSYLKKIAHLPKNGLKINTTLGTAYTIDSNITRTYHFTGASNNLPFNVQPLGRRHTQRQSCAV